MVLPNVVITVMGFTSAPIHRGEREIGLKVVILGAVLGALLTELLELHPTVAHHDNGKAYQCRRPQSCKPRHSCGLGEYLQMQRGVGEM